MDARRAGIDAGRNDAREAIDLRALERVGVADRLFDALRELGRPIGMAGDASLAGRPVAGREVVQDLRQPVLPQRLPEQRRFVVVGKQILDAGKARLLRRPRTDPRSRPR